MRIQINGEIKIEGISKIIESILIDTLNKMGQRTGSIKLSQVIFETAFMVEGYSEPVRMTVEHNGNIEPFIVVVSANEDGTIERAQDNEDQPFYDEVYHKLAKGEEIELPTEPISSEYADDEITEIDAVSGGDIKGVRYAIKSEESKQLLRYFNNNILIAEMTLTEKEFVPCDCETPCEECHCI
ncbi:MAG: hypothetical protein K0S71_301 [Clostridia bacterium]|jgi:hypothetical protein|nr:hypothetical protein [Clostridia bacterium]